VAVRPADDQHSELLRHSEVVLALLAAMDDLPDFDSVQAGLGTQQDRSAASISCASWSRRSTVSEIVQPVEKRLRGLLAAGE
jgi:hypothetical protein